MQQLPQSCRVRRDGAGEQRRAAGQRRQDPTAAPVPLTEQDGVTRDTQLRVHEKQLAHGTVPAQDTGPVPSGLGLPVGGALVEQRAPGADEVALQWSAWRSQVTDDASSDAGTAAPSTAAVASRPATPTAASPSTPSAASPGTPAEAEAEPRPTTWFDRPSTRKAAPPATAETPAGGTVPPGAAAAADAVADPYAGVRRALEELRGYLADPPPIGRVRSTDTGADGGARTLRADGPGWSLVARPDDMAFVLLDELPREVLPVARGPRLPALLEGLDAMAVRPS
ncbi:hypothetical protein [Streptomyces sp. NPDC057675]|uniref:hypothetical protein n=1 Tax=Streptomyces sp. NPDC057675 TaxID=3346204 RepID=UPI0036BA0A92